MVEGSSAPFVTGTAPSSEASAIAEPGSPSNVELTSPVIITQREGSLIGVYGASSGVLLATSHGAILLDRAGNQLSAWAAPGPVVAAAYDGQRLVMVSAGSFTTLSAELSVVTAAPLSQPCSAAVLLSSGLLACWTPAGCAGQIGCSSFQPIIRSYDASSGEALRVSLGELASGDSLRKIPGWDAFITVPPSNENPRFSFYRKLESGVIGHLETVYRRKSAEHVGYGFIGSPATHLVTNQGVRLVLRDACSENPMTRAPCLAEDGELGTLRGTQRILAADNDASFLYVLLSFDNIEGYLSGAECQRGCTVQRLDPSGRRVVDEAVYELPLEQIVMASHDPVSNALLVGSFSLTQEDRYRVDLLPYRRR